MPQGRMKVKSSKPITQVKKELSKKKKSGSAQKKSKLSRSQLHEYISAAVLWHGYASTYPINFVVPVFIEHFFNLSV